MLDFDVDYDDEDDLDDSDELKMYTIIVKVLCDEGEESMAINQVSEYDMEVMNPMLLDIRERGGYYPCGKFLNPSYPSPRDLYRKHLGWDTFQSLLPRPKSGFSHIIEVELFQEESIKLRMVK